MYDYYRQNPHSSITQCKTFLEVLSSDSQASIIISFLKKIRMIGCTKVSNRDQFEKNYFLPNLC